MRKLKYDSREYKPLKVQQADGGRTNAMAPHVINKQQGRIIGRADNFTNADYLSKVEFYRDQAEDLRTDVQTLQGDILSMEQQLEMANRQIAGLRARLEGGQ